MKHYLLILLLTSCAGEPFAEDLFNENTKPDAGADITPPSDAVREDGDIDVLWLDGTSETYDAAMGVDHDNDAGGDVVSCSPGSYLGTCGKCPDGWVTKETCTGSNCQGGCYPQPYAKCWCAL